MDPNNSQQDKTRQNNMRIHQRTIIHQQSNEVWGVSRQTSIRYHGQDPSAPNNYETGQQNSPPPPPPPPSSQ